jgi:hypothetical protein
MRPRDHHEELTAAPAVLQAIAVLVPFAGALWIRIRTGRKDRPKP